jgi:flavin-dependent dehydrogenase
VYYDVVVAGGSVAGLLCAREIARNNYTVLVIEEDYEIGLIILSNLLKFMLQMEIAFQLIQKSKELQRLAEENLTNR